MADNEGPAPPSPACPPRTYSGSLNRVSWTGITLDQDTMAYLLGGPLRARIYDLSHRDELVAEMRGLALGEVAEDAVKDLLADEEPPLSWEVGEALAEVVLAEWFGALWVWNSARDKRTKKASLPGADLVGLSTQGEKTRLLFGEVKTSNDTDCPPNVLYGKSGMIHQLESLTKTTKDHWTLIKWLQARCKSEENQRLFRQALRLYVSSKGRDIRLVGCLMRDTAPDERDLTSRCNALAPILPEHATAELFAWYIAEPVDSWPGLLGAGEA